MIPIAGSAYTYAYATLGELVAWIIGWDLILEYAVGNVAVAIAWSGYFASFLRSFGIDFPYWLSTSYRDVAISFPSASRSCPVFLGHHDRDQHARHRHRQHHHLAARDRHQGERDASTTPWWCSSWRCWRSSSAWGSSTSIPGTGTRSPPTAGRASAPGAAIVFFAYIGFDAISTAAEETKDPQRNMPIGIMGSLGICTVIYAVVGARGHRPRPLPAAQGLGSAGQGLRGGGDRLGPGHHLLRRHHLDDGRAAGLPAAASRGSSSR